MNASADFLRGNAYHEAGHAIVGWALGLCVVEITIRDDRPGEHTKMAGAERLPLIDRIAVLNAGRQAEEIFGHLLPSWASGRDREESLNFLSANGIRETQQMKTRIDEGRARAHELLRKHENDVHRLVARLIECRNMTGDEFKLFMESAKG
jgi:ATP-dependent Zn protease